MPVCRVDELATKFCQPVFTMIQVVRLSMVLIVPAALLWGCARQPAFVTKDEPWRRTDETQCLQSGYVRESRYVQARSALGGPEACGAIQPFEMTAASSGNVQLVPAATLRCPMIPAVDHWVSHSVQAAARAHLGLPVVEVKVAASYSCRPRNGIFGGKLSEHGHANALDVSAFRLADGRWVTVKDGWSSWSSDSRFLRAVHQGGCGIFTTVLGPNADSFHRDHFHLDLAKHGRDGSGRICK